MFDYETETDDETVRAVASEMAGGGLKPLSEEDIAEREIWREQQRQLAQQQATPTRKLANYPKVLLTTRRPHGLR